MHLKAQLVAEGAHAVIFGQYGRTNRTQMFTARNLNQTAVELSSDPLMLELIRHYNRSFSLVDSVQLAYTPHRHYLRLIVGWLAVFRDQSHLPVIINEAYPREPFVGGTRAQLQGLEVAQVNALRRECLVKLDH